MTFFLLFLSCVELSSKYAIDTDGMVHCWRWDDYGQLSDVPSGEFVQVSAAQYHSCGIDFDGAVHCWGTGSYDQVSDTPPNFRAWNGAQ